MKKKGILALLLSAAITVTGCSIPIKEKEENVKVEEVNNQGEEILKKAKVEIIKGNYEEAEDMVILGLLDYPEDKNLAELCRQVRSLTAIVKDMEKKKYEDAFLKCRILLIEENLDDTIKEEVEKLKVEIEKLSGGKLDKNDNKNRNVKIDKNKDISSSKALELALKYSKSAYNKKNMQCMITDMYLVDSKAYYSVYVYNIVLTNDGYYQENPIALLEVEMRTGKVYEVIAYKQEESWISENTAIEKAWGYVNKNGIYRPDYIEIRDIYGEGENIVYYIEAYDVYRDIDGYENSIYVGYFEVNVITGATTGYTKEPEIQEPEPQPEPEPEIQEPQPEPQPETTQPDQENTEQPPTEENQQQQEQTNEQNNNANPLNDTVEENPSL